MKTKFAQILLFGALAASPLSAKVTYTPAVVDPETGSSTVQGTEVVQTTDENGVVTTTTKTQTTVSKTDGSKENTKVEEVAVATPDPEGGFTAEVTTTTVVTHIDSEGGSSSENPSTVIVTPPNYTPPVVPVSTPPSSNGPGTPISKP